MPSLSEFSFLELIVFLLIAGLLGLGLALTLVNRLSGLSGSELLAQLLLNLVHTIGWLLATIVFLAAAHGAVGGQFPVSWHSG